MPSAEETTYLIEVMPDATSLNQDFGSRDVDVLVSRIKENLRLSSLKSRSSLAHKMRPSPYSLPNSRSWYETEVCQLCSVLSNSFSESSQEQQHQHHQLNHLGHNKHCRQRRKRRCDIDDYERFKALLKKGALIKEAVKRLNVEAIEDSYTSDDDKSRRGGTTDDNSEDEVSVAGDDFYRRKHFDYDDEDEPLYHDIYLGELE